MRTTLECLSCFTRQAAATARLCSNDPDMVHRVVSEADRLIAQLDLSLSPPENAVDVYALIAEITGVRDPYKKVRHQSNCMALGLRDRIRDRIEKSGNPVKTAVHYAVAANIIDYGALHDFDALEILSSCLQHNFFIDDTEKLLSELQRAAGLNVLYLADNSGEIVFDGLLIEQLQKFDCNVTLTVRDNPILNDVIMQDIAECGIDKICRVITSGTGCPGTPLASCSEEFQAVFHEADIIVSKGQGNFETLSDVDGPIFYLLTVKCPVVGSHIAGMRQLAAANGISNGEMILMQRSR